MGFLKQQQLKIQYWWNIRSSSCVCMCVCRLAFLWWAEKHEPRDLRQASRWNARANHRLPPNSYWQVAAGTCQRCLRDMKTLSLPLIIKDIKPSTNPIFFNQLDFYLYHFTDNRINQDRTWRISIIDDSCSLIHRQHHIQKPCWANSPNINRRFLVDFYFWSVTSPS